MCETKSDEVGDKSWHLHTILALPNGTEVATTRRRGKELHYYHNSDLDSCVLHRQTDVQELDEKDRVGRNYTVSDDYSDVEIRSDIK
ncbi:hypothetical protein BaRGS_00028221, partial [Batillaria attramentaria]